MIDYIEFDKYVQSSNFQTLDLRLKALEADYGEDPEYWFPWELFVFRKIVDRFTNVINDVQFTEYLDGQMWTIRRLMKNPDRIRHSLRLNNLAPASYVTVYLTKIRYDLDRLMHTANRDHFSVLFKAVKQILITFDRSFSDKLRNYFENQLSDLRSTIENSYDQP